MLVNSNYREQLEDISTLLTDAFDAYVVSKNDLDYSDENFEEIIASDFQMRGEVNIQNEIISYLKSKQSLEQRDIDYLIDMQHQNTSG